MPDVIFNNQYWLYTVDPEAEEPVMLINTHIGFDAEEGFGCMGDAFQRELLQLDALCIETNKKRIQVWINSPGGIVEDGMSIYSAILKSTTKVDTYCVGMAASIAGVIFQAGRQRIMSDYAYLMYHNPYGSDDEKGMAAITDMIVIAIASRTGKSKEDIIKIMNKTTWIGADEAVEVGLADKIETSGELNKKRAPVDAFDAKNFHRESAKIVNKITFKNTVMADNFPFSKIANKLGLHEMASQDAVVEELGKILNKKSDLEKKCEDLEKKMEDLEKKMEDHKSKGEDLQEKHDDLKAKHAELTRKMEDEEKAKKEEDEEKAKKAKAEDEDKAKNMVETAAMHGKIPGDTESLELWKKNAIKDMAGTKAILDKMPINKKASARIPKTAPVQTPVEQGSVIAVAMNRLQKKYLENE